MPSFRHLEEPSSKIVSHSSLSKIEYATKLDSVLGIIEISKLACWLFLSQILNKKFIQTIKKPGAEFNLMTIDTNNPLRTYINTIMPGYEISIARIYQFFSEQKYNAHIDHLYPGKEVIIIRLNPGESRLKIDSKLLPEAPGKGYIFPSDTFYEVLKGKDIRYSLVLWANKKQIK